MMILLKWSVSASLQKTIKNESLEMAANIISIRTLSNEEVPSDINHDTTILKSLDFKA